LFYYYSFVVITRDNTNVYLAIIPVNYK